MVKSKKIDEDTVMRIWERLSVLKKKYPVVEKWGVTAKEVKVNFLTAIGWEEITDFFNLLKEEIDESKSSKKNSNN